MKNEKSEKATIICTAVNTNKTFKANTMEWAILRAGAKKLMTQEVK